MNQTRVEYFEILSLGVAINGVSKALAITNAFKKKLSCFFETTAAFIACRAIIRKKFFSKSHKCPFHAQPCLSSDSFGVSEIFYAFTEPLWTAMIDISSRKFCAKKYEEVSGNPYAENDCFERNYVYELVTRGSHVV